MDQLPLFPPAGAATQPLPHEAIQEARDLLAELIVVLLQSAAEEALAGKGEEVDEQN